MTFPATPPGGAPGAASLQPGPPPAGAAGPAVGGGDGGGGGGGVAGVENAAPAVVVAVEAVTAGVHAGGVDGRAAPGVAGGAVDAELHRPGRASTWTTACSPLPSPLPAA